MTLLDIDNRRAIIDRRAIADRIAGLSGKKLSNEVSTILREALAGAREEIARLKPEKASKPTSR